MIRIIKLLLLFFAYQLAVTAIVAGGFMVWNHSVEMPNPSADYYVTFLMLVQVTFTILLSCHLVFGKYVKFHDCQLGLYKHAWMWLLSLAMIIGLGLWNNYLNELVDLPNTMEDFFVDMMRHPLGIFSTVIMAPLMEELLFRGAIQGYLLSKWRNPVWAIVVSSLLFGVVHGNPAQIPFAFLIGLGLGWVYYKTGSLFPCVFMHFINNGSAVLIFWLTNNADATLIETCGFTWATIMAIGGIALTAGSIWGLCFKMKGREYKWLQSFE